MLLTWRRERDSNPRYRFRHSGFQDHRHRPLGHPSASKCRLNSRGSRRRHADRPCVTGSVIIVRRAPAGSPFVIVSLTSRINPLGSQPDVGELQASVGSEQRLSVTAGLCRTSAASRRRSSLTRFSAGLRSCTMMRELTATRNTQGTTIANRKRTACRHSRRRGKMSCKDHLRTATMSPRLAVSLTFLSHPSNR